jgi:hypothetical protein
MVLELSGIFCKVSGQAIGIIPDCKASKKSAGLFIRNFVKIGESHPRTPLRLSTWAALRFPPATNRHYIAAGCIWQRIGAAKRYKTWPSTGFRDLSNYSTSTKLIFVATPLFATIPLRTSLNLGCAWIAAATKRHYVKRCYIKRCYVKRCYLERCYVDAGNLFASWLGSTWSTTWATEFD